MEDKKELVCKLGFTPLDGTVGVYQKTYGQHKDYCINVDFLNKKFDYGNLIMADCKTTQNFSQAENWVVLECVDRLLEKGYKPQNIILEKTWAAGHGTSGRLDVCVTHDDGSEYLLIECKTYGKEFDKAVTKMYKDGGQLFTYFKFSNKADLIMLYASELQGNEIVYKNEIVKIEDDYRVGDVKDFYEKWNKLTKDNGVFDCWVKPYCFESKALVKSQLKPINQEDSSFIFNQFLEILRHNVVSDKGNAFNKIFTLFLCKVYDETSKQDGDELDFQWKEGVDNHVDFQLRLTDLYKNGMDVFLSRTVSDFDEKEFENKYKTLDENVRKELKAQINRLRLEKNNEFAIKEVYDHDSFIENAKIVKEVVELLQGYRIRYNKRQQYLSDFFELLLTTGLKQEAGQFFTPVPIAQFIIKSLPLDKIVDEKLKSKNGELLPYMIDYAAGSGHFITEYMHEVQNIITQKDPKKYIEGTKKALSYWQNANYEWATDYVYGVEKDYRLVKVGKVGCYLHGDGLANVILSDGLGNFVDTKDYKGKLKKSVDDNSKDNQQFDIILSNPPYSVSSFKQTTRDFYTEKDFDLYDKLTDNSSEIECLFVERTKQLLKDGGVAGIILPSSILTNTGIYTKTRELLLKYFEIVGITELGSNTFMATGTNTVVLFLRRRNNYECVNLEKSIDKFFENQTDVTINGIETPVLKYINYVWEGLSFDDYVTLLNKTPNDKVKNHDLFKEYAQKIKTKSDKEFWNKVIALEKEKLYYFILAYPQKLVVIKTGEKDAEKQFLGYEFSNRRGSEGIHAIQRNKSIEECTKLFDINSFDNPQKASTYIYKAFNNDLNFEIDETLKNNISRINLLDMMTFDRVDFEKVVNVKAKKKVKIESSWNIAELGTIESLVFEKGKSITKQDAKEGDIPVVAGGIDFAYSHNVANRKPNVITISASGANSGFVNFWNKPIWASDCSTIISNDEKKFKIKYIYEVMKSRQEDLFDYQKGNAQPHVYIDDIKKFKIPLPPIDIQQKIVDEIEKVEINTNCNIQKVSKIRLQINTIIDNVIGINRYIKDITEKVTDGSHNPPSKIGENEYKMLSATNITDNGLDYSAGCRYISEQDFIRENQRTQISKDDILLSIVGTIGKSTMIQEDNLKLTVQRSVAVIKVNQALVAPKYLLYYIKGNSFQNILQHNAHGNSQKGVYLDQLKNIQIPVPSIEEQQKIVSEIKELEKQIAEAQAIIDNSKQQKQEILDKYLK